MQRFEFIVEGQPFSANNLRMPANSNRRRFDKQHAWQGKVRQAAEAQWNLAGRTLSERPLAQPIEIVITTFVTNPGNRRDVDNVIKPILDALKKSEIDKEAFYLYRDDVSIHRIVSQRIDASESLRDSEAADTHEYVHIMLLWE